MRKIQYITLGVTTTQPLRKAGLLGNAIGHFL